MDAYQISLYTTVVIIAVVLGAIIGYFGYSVFYRQRLFIRLQKDRIIAEMKLVDCERDRMSKDMHDELGPYLMFTKIQLSLASLGGPDARELIEGALKNVGYLMERMSGIVHNEVPKLVEEQDLQELLAHYLEQVKELSQLHFDFQYEVSVDLKAEVKLQLFRIVQEVIQNAMKHAHAHFFVLHVQQAGKMLYLYCRDNGTGMAGREDRGLGLESLQNRALLLGGQMRVLSDRQPGTCYFFQIPIDGSKLA